MTARWIALALLTAAVSRPANLPPKDRMVILISLDGFPARVLADRLAPVPTLRRPSRCGFPIPASPGRITPLSYDFLNARVHAGYGGHGGRLDQVNNVDVAPTAASLLGLRIPGATCRA